MKERIKLLKSMHNALDNLEVKGKQNHIIVAAVMNDIEKLVAEIEAEDDGAVTKEVKPC